MIYDFKKGDTANFLLDTLKAEIGEASTFEVIPITNVSVHEIEFKGNTYVYRQGENEIYMFAYKSRFETIKHGTLPKYHIMQCETRRTYSGYRFANQMPVDIYCANQRKDMGPKHLELCRHCVKEVNFFSFGTSDMPWYDVVLKLANKRDYTQEDIKANGYTRDWGHVSKAYREKKNYICEQCAINLSDRYNQYFCEVHHKDRDKANNKTKNLECLCITCHSEKDEIHRANYSKGANNMKLNQFKLLLEEI